MIDLALAKRTIEKYMNVCFIPLPPVTWTVRPNLIGLEYRTYDDYSVTFALTEEGDFFAQIFLYRFKTMTDRVRAVIKGFNRAEENLKLKEVEIKGQKYLTLIYEGHIDIGWDIWEPLGLFDRMTMVLLCGDESPGCAYIKELKNIAAGK